MFQILRDTKIDFMGRMNVALVLSGLFMLGSIAALAIFGLNMGIEFSGGTELQVKYRDAPDIAAIRSTLSAAGVTNSSVTTLGELEEHEVYIRLGNAVAAEDEEDPTAEVVAALHGGVDTSNDLNVIDRKALAAILLSAPSMTSSAADDLAAEVLTLRKEQAIFDSAQDLASAPGITPEVLQYLDEHTVMGPIAVRSQSYIYPAVGAEIQRKAGLAILGSLLGMLVYIWIRFRWQWGVAGMLALVHDTLFTLGLFALFGKELTLPVVAAFLTLVGYSINDTVVIFDRIRENQPRYAGKPFESVINLSINQTLSRTVITSGTTVVVVLSLLLFGGAALSAFAFVLTVGIIVGTYSTIFVASPALALWERYGARKGGARGGAAAPAESAASRG